MERGDHARWAVRPRKDACARLIFQDWAEDATSSDASPANPRVWLTIKDKNVLLIRSKHANAEAGGLSGRKSKKLGKQLMNLADFMQWTQN